MKLSVFTVMIGRDYNLEQTAELVAKTGYDAIEWRVADDFHVPLTGIRKAAAHVGQVTSASGLELCALATYLRASQYAEAVEVLEAAAELGCPKVRIGVDRYDRSINYNTLYDRNCGALAKLEPLALKLGVKAQIEIHMGNIACSPSLAHRILRNFNPEAVGAIFDPGNMIYEGLENCRMGLELLGPWLSHVHVKNSKWVEEAPGKWKATWAAMSGGIVQWPQVIEDLRSVGYDGVLSLEDFGAQPVQDKLRSDYEYMRGLLS